jgi:redox-sensitive bicupin YhaK (pirin superfamily)
MTRSETNQRSIARIVHSLRTLEGAGFVVNRPFPTAQLIDVDPFLLLDEMGPVELGAGEAKGAPDHPHRGFETVTYMIAGKMEHRDSQGNAGQLGPGDVQWMTAGRGVIHSEMPEKEFARCGGRMHGFQLWVNLPRPDKMMGPRYQEIPSARIPTVTTEDGSVIVRVIAGEAMGAKAVIDTRTPIMMLHYSLEPGADAVQTIPNAYNAFGYVFNGAALFGVERRSVSEHEMVLFARNGDTISFAASPETSGRVELLLIAGVPLNESVVRYGPFVMNTKEEIAQAITDYQSGNFGAIATVR